MGSSSHGAWGTTSTSPVLTFKLVFLLVAALIQASSALLGDPFQLGNCSSKCESEHCGDVFKIRYGKYCGAGYSGCPGEPPCDALDDCCRQHDVCVGPRDQDLLAARCTRQLRDCVEKLRASGNDVTFPVNNCSVTDIEGTVLDISNVLLLTNAASPVARPHLSACLLWLPLATAVSATLFGSQFTLF